MSIAQNKAVTLAYTLKDDKGNILDQADAQQPFIYLHGTGGIIPGLEKALENKTTDDQFSVTIEPKDGYGEVNDNLTQEVPREMFGGIDDSQLVVGAVFHAQTNAGVETVTIKKLEGDTVTIDSNHPLAGTTLNFDVTVLDVRDATEEELAHGHIHAGGGCGGGGGGCGGGSADTGCGGGGCS
jgi:FKBP-type peptidyl-prolyl cis-trans isomerase SlyD